MQRISVSPRKPADAYLRRARAQLKRADAVVLVARGTAAHRHLREIYRAFPSGRPIRPMIYQHQASNEWYLLLAPPGMYLELDEHGVPKTTD